MKFVRNGETIHHDCMVIETPEEYKKIIEALQTVEDLNNGTLLKYIEKELERVKI